VQQPDTSSAGRPRPSLRRIPAVVIAACLALGVVVAPGAAIPAQAANGLTEESHARYVVGAQGKVTATVTTTFTNATPDSGSRYYYWDTYGIPVPASAKDLTATSGGTTLTVRTSAADDPNTRYAEVSFAPLRYGRTRTIEWSYRIAGNPVRDELWSRSGPGYATFPVQSWADDGRTSAVVDVPTGMTFDATDEFAVDPGAKRTVYSVDEHNQDGGIWAAVSVRNPEKSDEREVAVGDATLTVQSLPGDDRWLDFAGEHVGAGVPELERLIGHPWPGRVDVVREDVSPQVLGYAWFDDQGGEIVVGEELDEPTLYHELGHAWFDADRFDGRWLYEGLTEVAAYRVLDAVDGDGTPRGAPDPTSRRAFPMLEWSETERDHAADDYGYPAAYSAVHEVLGELDDETFTAVVSAAYAGEDPYAPAGSRRFTSQVDWRQFLDLAAERGGVDGSEAMRTWVVGSDDAAVLDERSVAREAYAAYDEADGAWQAPRQLRRSMTTWSFEEATDAIEALAEAAPAAVTVQTAAQDTGLSVPEPVLAAYDDAKTGEEYAALPALLTQAATTIDDVGSVSDAVAAESDVVTELGEDVLDAEGTAGAARTALADGDLDEAVALAADARTAADRALWVGAAVVAAVLVVLALLVLLPVALVRRARRRRTELTEPQVIAVVAAPDPDRAAS
jgi:hypothetical protein